MFHNSDVFGSCIIRILYTGCAKIKKNSGAKTLKENVETLVAATRETGLEISADKTKYMVMSRDQKQDEFTV